MTQEQQSQLDLTLTAQDVTLYTKFWVLCKQHGKTEFTSDTFRNFHLDKKLKDTKHGIGGTFARWKHSGLIWDTEKRVRSTRPENNGRKISVYTFRGMV